MAYLLPCFELPHILNQTFNTEYNSWQTDEGLLNRFAFNLWMVMLLVSSLACVCVLGIPRAPHLVRRHGEDSDRITAVHLSHDGVLPDPA